MVDQTDQAGGFGRVLYRLDSLLERLQLDVFWWAEHVDHDLIAALAEVSYGREDRACDVSLLPIVDPHGASLKGCPGIGTCWKA